VTLDEALQKVGRQFDEQVAVLVDDGLACLRAHGATVDELENERARIDQEVRAARRDVLERVRSAWYTGEWTLIQ
jgi:hypothetical protein